MIILKIVIILTTLILVIITAQKLKFSIKDFFGKCDQIRSFLRIWSHLLKESFMENFIFCAVNNDNNNDNSNNDNDNNTNSNLTSLIP